MHRKILMFLALLCLFLLAFGVGYMRQQTRLIEAEIVKLKTEIELLEAENEYLRMRLQELRLLQEVVLDRMERWLNEWQVEEFEATAYTLECGNGDGYTASMTVPRREHTIAVDPAVIPLGSRVYVQGLGWRKAEDIGAAIRGYTVDLYMGAGPEAKSLANRWGRRIVKMVYQKCSTERRK